MLSTLLREFFRRFPAHLFRLVIGLAVVVTLAHAKKFQQATLGSIEIYTSESPEITTRFVAELQALRSVVQELVGPVQLPTPRMQIVVFRSHHDYRDFVPTGIQLEKDRDSVSGFTANEYALTVAVVGSDVDAARFGRDAVLYFYAQYLIKSVAPRAPLWVITGLPEVLAGLVSKREQIFLGADYFQHAGKLRPKSFLPLAELMDDASMTKFFNAPKHDNALYHESWALWHQWLTGANAARREQIRALFAALRRGEKGDLETVANAFAEPAEAIEKSHRSRSSQSNLRIIKIEVTQAQLTDGLSYQPATEVEALSAPALVFAAAGKGLGTLGLALLQATDRFPSSPRLQEALAALATGERNTAAAALRWERARELGTDNPFAYVIAARTALSDRRFRLELQPQIAEERADAWRAWIDRALALNGGNAEAHYYNLLVEAFAPAPRPAALDLTEQAGLLAHEPSAMMYLAIARWRAGDRAHARLILEKALEQPNLSHSIQRSLTSVLEAMTQIPAIP